MKKLLFHVSRKKHNVLMPKPGKKHGVKKYEKCVCFSMDKFISYFGQWIYIFDYEYLKGLFKIIKKESRGLQTITTDDKKKYTYEATHLGFEYRIFKPIDVNKHAISVAKNYNCLEGTWEEVFTDRVCEKIIEKMSL